MPSFCARRARAAALSTVVSLGISTSTAHANPMDTYGLGARNVSMAGAVAASVDDYGANYYNPGGVLRPPTTRLDVGYHYAVNQLFTNDANNGVDPAHGFSAGLLIPSQLFGLRFGFGLAVYVPDDRLVRNRLLEEWTPRWELFENRIQRLYFAANIAIAPVPWLRIGGGVSYLAQTHGVLGVVGDINVARPTDSLLQHTVDADVVAVYYPQVGVQVDALRNLRFGAVFRGEFQFRVDLDALVTVNGVAGSPSNPMAPRYPALITLQERAATAYLPMQGVIGVGWDPVPSVTLGLDVTYVAWSRHVSPTPYVNAAIAFDPPPQLGIMLPRIPPAVQPPPTGFNDVFVPRVGAEWRVPVRAHTLALRAGYRYDPTPVPDQSMRSSNFLDASRHAITAGVGWVIRGLIPGPATRALRADVYFEAQVLESRTVQRNDPIDRVGDYRLGGTVLNMGVNLAATF